MRKAFLNYLTYEKKLSPHTIKAYQTDLDQFEAFCEQNKITNLLSVDYKFLRQWIIYLLDSPVSVNSVHRKISSLKTFFRFAIRQGALENNPAKLLVLPKKDNKLPAFLKESETDLLFSDDLFTNDFQGTRDKLVLHLLYMSGIRRGEMISLKVSDVDFNRKTIFVTGKGNKTRFIPVPQWLLNEITIYIELRNAEFAEIKSDILILTNKGNEVYPEMIYRIVNHYIGIVSTNTRKSPHLLRHTFATQMLNSGADLNAIKELLGHANLAATQVYTHNSFQKLKKAYMQAHPRA